MKSKAILFVLLLIFSNCNTVTINDTNKYVETSIIGDWTNCAREYKDGTRMTGNVCLKLLFNEDHSGVVTGGDGSKEKFTWTTEADNLVLKNASKNKHQLFSNGDYRLIEPPNKSGKEITIFDSVKNIRYFLSK